MATFGRYEILERIASGGMAEVYRARAWGAGEFAKDVVIKKILPNYSSDPEFRSLFIQEARISVGLTHSRIVQVLDFGIMEGSYFIALELVDGPNLGELLHAQRKSKTLLPLGATVHVITEALSGLDYAHRRTDPAGRPMEIVHRDVSPSNVLLSFDGEVKIGDFGIARAAGSPSLTRVGRVRGKPQYMSPEQIKGHPLDARSDLFSAGLLLYEMVSGFPAYGGLDDNAIMNAILAGDLAPPSSRNHDLPRTFDPVLKKALNLDADQRYASAAELRQAILDVAYLERIRPDPDQLAAVIKRSIARNVPAPAAVKQPSAVLERSGSSDGELQQFTSTGTSSRPVPGEITMESERVPVARANTPVEPSTAESTRGPANTPSTLDPPPKMTRVLPPAAKAAPVEARGGSPVAKAAPVAETTVMPPDESVTNTNAPPRSRESDGDTNVRPANATSEETDVRDVRTRPPSAPSDEPSATQIRIPRPAQAIVEPNTGPSALADDRQTLYPADRAAAAPAEPHAAIAVAIGIAVVLVGYLVVALTGPSGKTAAAPAPVARVSPTIAEPGARTGTLSLNSKPWGEVTIDGRSAGPTPIVDHALPAGTHAVVISGAGGVSATFSVTIESGKPTRRSVELK